MAVANLAGIQRMTCLAITGAFPSVPGAALDCCLNLTPLDIVIQAIARRSAYCLQQAGLWSDCTDALFFNKLPEHLRREHPKRLKKQLTTWLLDRPLYLEGEFLNTSFNV
ncbi:hypothetical protein J6590_072832 [Homalodisca vitripennis]|nr:hypothetical protein J6590_072832 [Homalodisca vitripennis]